MASNLDQTRRRGPWDPESLETDYRIVDQLSDVGTTTVHASTLIEIKGGAETVTWNQVYVAVEYLSGLIQIRGASGIQQADILIGGIYKSRIGLEFVVYNPKLGAITNASSPLLIPSSSLASNTATLTNLPETS